MEVDPSVLGDERVQRAVEGRFLDSAISVREAAMELVGRHIVNRPDFALKVILLVYRCRFLCSSFESSSSLCI